MTISRIERPIQISGKLDDPLWNNAIPITMEYEINPGENSPAPQKTLVYALYTNENIYFGFRCFDSHPDEIRANMTDRDKIFRDDFVMVILDTYGDHQRGYEFAVNPFGIQGDLMRTLGSEDETFDIIWNSAASRNDSGWTAEFCIPFKSLRFPVEKEQQWSILLYRVYPRDSRVIISWTPNDRNNPSDLSQSGTLAGLSGLEAGGTLEILPFAMGQQYGALRDAGNPASGFQSNAILGRVGGGIQYSPSSNFSLDAVINPDFSQIESDAEQIDVNTTFALYYPEKRPFFLVGQELLQTPMYYSRSINNPFGAARVIGKTGSLSYVYLGALDRNTPFDIPGEEESDPFPTSLRSFSNIGRLRYEFGNETYLGGMAMMRDFTNAHNYVVGADWNYRFWKNWYFSGEGFISHTKEFNDSTIFYSQRELGSTGITAGFNGETYYGTGIHLVCTHTARDYNFAIVYNDFSPTYQTYTGSFSLTNYRQFYMEHGYTWYPEKIFIDRFRIFVDADMQFNYDGIKKEQYVQPGICVMMKGQTHLDLSYLALNEERFRGILFRDIRRFNTYLNIEPMDELSITINGQLGRFIHRNASLPEMGTGHYLESMLTIKPTSQLKLDFSYIRARLSSEATNQLFYDGYIFRTVAGFQFTTEMLARTILSYNSFNKSYDFFPLFSYKLNAFTTFYTGMTNSLLDYGKEAGYTTTVRQYFVKLQYMIRT